MTAPVYDVALVGCGPVGALAANLLGKAGLRTVVIERETVANPMPRAVHLDHEMMRLFESAGVLARVEPLMFATDGHLHIGADLGVIRYLGTRHDPKPFTFSNDYFFYQPELERELRTGMLAHPSVSFTDGCEVIGISQDPSKVTIELGTPDGLREITADYVIACDGARSTVRKALGIELDDLGFEEPWLVVDVEIDGEINFPDFHGVPPQADLQRLSLMLCDPRRPTTVVPGRGNHRRWEFMLLPGESDVEMMRAEAVQTLLAPWIADVPHRIIRAATYRFHGLIAEHWRAGRVFLAGDAAHQTPPFFGQGMCHGFRDVANLAWKLAMVQNGLSAPELLASYQAERDPHVRSVVGASIEAGRYICQLDPDRAYARDLSMRRTMLDDRPRTAAEIIPKIVGGVISSGAGAGTRFIQPMVIAGDSEPRRLDTITGGGWVLLIAAPGKFSKQSLVRFHTVVGSGCFVAGRDFDDIGDFLKNWFTIHDCAAVVIRPDFYVYGTASGDDGLTRLLDGLETIFNRPRELAA